MKFLLVDDDPVALEFLSSILIGCGYEDLVCMQSGNEALQLLELQQTSFDCLIFDLEMPDIDGIALCRTVRQLKKYRETVIVMIMVENEEERISSAFNAGATHYITQPFEVLDLIKSIRIAETVEVSLHVRELALFRSGRRSQREIMDNALKKLEVKAGTALGLVSRLHGFFSDLWSEMCSGLKKNYGRGRHDNAAANK